MYVSRLEISNIRSIEEFSLTLQESECAGWHVLLGANGSGKSSVVRSLAVVLAGPANAVGLNQVWRDWQRQNAPPAKIEARIVAVDGDDAFTRSGRIPAAFQASVGLVSREGSSEQLDLFAIGGAANAERSIWTKVESRGWFAASFGPFRRFTGGELAYERLFFASPRLAGHLSAFNEAVALTEGLRWLSSLRVSSFEADEQKSSLLDAVLAFINETDLLPGGARIEEVRTDRVLVRDAGGALVPTDQLSDGYRSILSMIFELIRQLGIAFGLDRLIHELRRGRGSVGLSGVVAVDEIDAHLHPDWQARIGEWFTRVFPRMQFIVTTHSPIICRNARSIWWLPRPGTRERPRRLDGQDFERLTMGSILDAYGTELFGRGVTRSQDSRDKLRQLAELNRKALRGTLSPDEWKLMTELRAALPSTAATVKD